MDDRICPLVSGQNGLLVHCLGENCSASRTALLVPGGEAVRLCSVCDRLPCVAGR